MERVFAELKSQTKELRESVDGFSLETSKPCIMRFKASGWFAYYCGIKRMVWGIEEEEKEIVWDVYFYGDIGIAIDDFSALNMSNLWYLSKLRKQ